MSESTPLLVGPGAPAQEEVVDPIKTPEELRRSLIRWILFWTVFLSLTAALVVSAIRDGGGEFDWLGALKKAGGGVSHRTCSRGADAATGPGRRDVDGDSGVDTHAVADRHEQAVRRLRDFPFALT